MEKVNLIRVGRKGVWPWYQDFSLIGNPVFSNP